MSTSEQADGPVAPGSQEPSTGTPPLGASDSSQEPMPEELLAGVRAVPEPVEPVHGFLDALPGQLPDRFDAAEVAVTTVSTGIIAPPDVIRPVVRKPIKRPGWGFLLSHPAHWIALGFGSGLPWVVPGTFGTLFGWASFVVCMPHFTDAHWALSIVLGFLVGVWACGVTGRNLGVSDHGSIVWDEIVAIWLVLWLVPKTPMDQAMAFLIFRIIDITKPQPIKYFDMKWKNGFGVMFDDLLAAFFTLLIFALYYRVVGLPA